MINVNIMRRDLKKPVERNQSVKTLRKPGLLPKNLSGFDVILRIEERGTNGQQSYASEQIINKLREAEILLSQGAVISQTSRKIPVTEQTEPRRNHHA